MDARYLQNAIISLIQYLTQFQVQIYNSKLFDTYHLERVTYHMERLLLLARGLEFSLFDAQLYACPFTLL